MRRLSLLVGIVFLGWLSPAKAQTPVRDRIRASAANMSTDLHTAQYGKLVDLMYPKVVSLGGGRDKIIDFLKRGADEMSQQGYKFGNADMGPASEPVAGGDKLFSVVPQTIRMTGPNVKVEQTSYLLAISSDKGKTWTFVDGAGVKPDVIKQLFPELPASLVLPEPTPPKATPLS